MTITEYLQEQKRLAEDAEADSTSLYAHPSGDWTVKSSKRTIIAMDALVESVPKLIAALEAVRALLPNPTIPCPHPDTCDGLRCRANRAIETALGGEGDGE